MHLLDALVAGVRGAENGWAEIYQRGTATRATYYTDFDGDTAITTGANVTLDANAGAVIYVNEPVDVLVKNGSGIVVRSFTAFVTASATELISTAFTGTDYDTAATGLSLPVRQDTVMDRWILSGGAPDWKVLIAGVATTLQTAFSGSAAVYFNVKAPAYGAVGNGATDDTVAIQAAITAAQAGGGVVWFPAGTYRCTSQLNITGTCVFQGPGRNYSFLVIDHATANLLVFSGGELGVVDLTINAKQSNTGTLLSVGAGSFATLRGAQVGSSAHLARGKLITNQGVLWMYATRVWGGKGNKSVYEGTAGERAYVVNSEFVLGSVAFTDDFFLCNYIVVTGCRFDMSLWQAGTTGSLFALGATGDGRFTGNNFLYNGGTADVLALFNLQNNFGVEIEEAGNAIFPAASFDFYKNVPAAARVEAGLRRGRTKTTQYAANLAATVDEVRDHDTVAYECTGAGSPTLTLTLPTTDCADGWEVTVIISNYSGVVTGNVSILGVIDETGVFVIALSRVRAARYVLKTITGYGRAWVQTGPLSTDLA